MAKRKSTDAVSPEQVFQDIAGLVDAFCRARLLKREFQEEALRKGLIPYLPEKRPMPARTEDDDEGDLE
jgi:hypothetical protein